MNWKFSLDFLRAMAILLILFYHYPIPPIDYLGAELYIHIHKGFKSGVELFFVLSGFLIASHWFQQIKKKENLSAMMQDFYVKRTFRILPLYYLILIFEMLRATFLTKLGFNPWSYLTLTQNIFGKTIFGVSWSLCVEEHFYLFFPIISYVFFYFRKPKLFVCFSFSLLLLSIFLRFKFFDFLLSNPRAELDQNTAFILDGLVTGILIAYLHTFYGDWALKLKKHVRTMEISGFILFSLGLYLAGSDFYFMKIVLLPTIFCLSYGLFVISANYENSFFNFSRKSSFIVLTSKISYPLYLTHYTSWMILGIFFKRLNLDLPGLIVFPISFLAAYLLAFLLHEIVEKRFLRLRNRMLSRPKEINPVPQPVLSGQSD